MNKLIKGMLIVGISTMMTTSVFAKTTMEDVKKIQQSKDNVTVTPVNAYINWKSVREDMRANQIVVEFDINNTTLCDDISGTYRVDVKEDDTTKDLLEVSRTNFSKELMVIQDGVQLNPFKSKSEYVKVNGKGKMYIIFWTNNQNQTIDVVLGDEIISIMPTQISEELSKKLGTIERENRDN